ncbi:copia protein [Tanacetum coccineum]
MIMAVRSFLGITRIAKLAILDVTLVDPLPPFNEARSRLVLEETRKNKQAANASIASGTTFVAIAPSTSPNHKHHNNNISSSNSPNPTPQRNDNFNRRRGRNNGYRGGGRNGGRGRGRGRSNNFHRSQFQQWTPYGPWAWSPYHWASPPPSFPTAPWFRHTPPPSGSQDDQWYMDTGATLHMTTSPDALRHSLIDFLAQEFAMKNLGPLNYFLGIAVKRHQHGLFLSQSQYASDILERAGMSSCKSSSTPVDTKAKLSANSGNPYSDPTHYRSLAGVLQYLTFTHPDISYVVQQTCLHMHDPREEHMTTLKRILRYVQDTRRSTYGYCVYLGDNLISWSSKRQPMLSCSSAEAEYHRVANVIADIFTKGLPRVLFDDFRDSLSIRPPPTSTARVY